MKDFGRRIYQLAIGGVPGYLWHLSVNSAMGHFECLVLWYALNLSPPILQFALALAKMATRPIDCKKCGVSEHPRGTIFSCFHGNLYCYHGNRKILLPWGVQLHHIFYTPGPTKVLTCNQQSGIRTFNQECLHERGLT